MTNITENILSIESENAAVSVVLRTRCVAAVQEQTKKGTMRCGKRHAVLKKTTNEARCVAARKRAKEIIGA